jgi:hypothetical protein
LGDSSSFSVCGMGSSGGCRVLSFITVLSPEPAAPWRRDVASL